MNRKKIRKNGLTLTETMLAVTLVTTCMVAVGSVFLDSQKAWNETYGRAYSGIMLESHQAAKAFEATIRKATCEKYLLDNADPDTGKRHWVEVYYYASGTSTTLDRYARLYVSEGAFCIEYGSLEPRQAIDVISICENVTQFSFSNSGRCIRLQMTLSDNNHDVSFISSAVPQNQ